MVQKLVKDVLENILEAEMDEHLGRDKYQRQSNIEPGERNYRNGYSQKNLRSSFGDVDLDIPRDRKSEFEPQIVKKYETVCNELDKKIISLYAKGMTTSDIQAEIEDLYGITISPSMVSKITDKVIATATEWQNRMLDKIYPIVYLDAMYFKVRSNGKIVNKAVYICLGYTMEGYKDILGLWVDEAEGAKFWLGICNDLKNRGVKEILIACMDGLKGLPQAIQTVFPSANIQTCIVHQIRNSIKYIASKDKKSFMKDLKDGNYITLESIKYEKNGNLFNIKPIFLKKIDEKIDDGIHNRGLARGSCTSNYSTKDDSVSYNLAKSCKALLFSLE